MTRFCYLHFPQAQITTIEINPDVITVCRSMFHLPENDERLNVVLGDAQDVVNNSENRNCADVLQVDLYDAAALGPVFDTPEFYRACLTKGGILAVNLFGEHPSYKKNFLALLESFELLISLPATAEGNVVILGFNTSIDTSVADLYERPVAIETNLRLPARYWLNGIKLGMPQADE